MKWRNVVRAVAIGGVVTCLAGCPDTSGDDDAPTGVPGPEESVTPDPSPAGETATPGLPAPTPFDCGEDTPCPTDCGDDDTTPAGEDADGDRYLESEDCDDTDPLVNPGRAETPYDGRDNDCDPSTPDDDLDGDGWGIADDCDDGDAQVAPDLDEICDFKDNDCNGEVDDNAGDWWYLDADGDGFGDTTQSILDCDGFLRYVRDDTDCDDLDSSVYPGAGEVCDGVDNDCDGEVDEEVQGAYFADLDGDGHGDAGNPILACSPSEHTAEVGDDCDDSDPGVHPDAEEICNGVDDDCDGLTDDEDDSVTGQETFYQDSDGDGFGDVTYSVAACVQPPGAVPDDTDCDDTSPDVFPGAVEVCNGIDDDCDGLSDEADPDLGDAVTFYSDTDGDGYGDPSSPVLACTLPDGAADNDGDCDDSDPSRNPETVWYADGDGDGFGGDDTVVQCAKPGGYVSGQGDCNDGVADIHPGAEEVCNGLDDDCDGLIDSLDPDLVGGDTFYADTDGDGFGDPSNTMSGCQPAAGFVLNFSDCDDSNSDISPDAPEAWYDDIDSDCDGELDPDPCVDPPPATTVPVDATCTYVPEETVFNPVQEWYYGNFSDYSSHSRVYSTPVVGQMTDDNGDGVIDERDVPDVVITAQNASSSGYDGVVRLLSGDGTSVHWTAHDLTWDGSTYYPYRYSGAALGDIDSDGAPEIVIIVEKSNNCYPAALDRYGTPEWVYTGETVGCRNTMPAVHDLEGDGDVEVIVGRLILNGGDGSLQGRGNGGRGYYSGYSNSGYHAFGVDLDLDGVMEVVAGSSVYDPDGNTLCSTGFDDGYPAAADLDGDGLGEFVVTGNGYVRLFHYDCTYIRGWSLLGGGRGGPANIGDFDGDGVPEIGIAGTTKYVVYETDGSILWSMPITDESSNSTGSSLFDFDGNGTMEVVYGDEERLWVFDGATGRVLLEDDFHESGTINECPTIADVDGDGRAEIVVVNSRDDEGVYALGDADDNWMGARRVWNQQAYYITNIEDDLSVPRIPEPNWPRYNSFRQGGPGSSDPAGAPNLYPIAYDPCDQPCAGQVVIVVQVANEGLIRAGGVLLALYGEADDGSRIELETRFIDDPLEPGTLSEAMVFWIDEQDLTGMVRMIVAVDADASFNECNEDDNEVSLTL